MAFFQQVGYFFSVFVVLNLDFYADEARTYQGSVQPGFGLI